jgi:hypothetical protein
MSRQRGCLTTDFRRLRNDVQIFQASDAEIQSDLTKLKYVKKVEPQPEVVIKQELPKKRKAPVDDDKYVIDGLLRLQSTKAPEVKKKQEEVVEKKPEVLNKPQYQQLNWMNYFALQNQYMMRGYFMPPAIGMIPNFQCQSSADRHLKIAIFIQSHKNTKRT